MWTGCAGIVVNDSFSKYNLVSIDSFQLRCGLHLKVESDAMVVRGLEVLQRNEPIILTQHGPNTSC
jgi:hypothetical protein